MLLQNATIDDAGIDFSVCCNSSAVYLHWCSTALVGMFMVIIITACSCKLHIVGFREPSSSRHRRSAEAPGVYWGCLRRAGNYCDEAEFDYWRGMLALIGMKKF